MGMCSYFINKYDRGQHITYDIVIVSLSLGLHTKRFRDMILTQIIFSLPLASSSISQDSALHSLHALPGSPSQLMSCGLTCKYQDTRLFGLQTID